VKGRKLTFQHSLASDSFWVIHHVQYLSSPPRFCMQLQRILMQLLSQLWIEIGAGLGLGKYLQLFQRPLIMLAYLADLLSSCHRRFAAQARLLWRTVLTFQVLNGCRCMQGGQWYLADAALLGRGAKGYPAAAALKSMQEAGTRYITPSNVTIQQ
jgi:hypothetical protein